MTAVTVGLRSVPKITAKYAQKIGSPQHLMLSLPPTVETRQRTPFALTKPTQTRTTRWPAFAATTCVFGKSSGRATERILHCSAAELRATKIDFKTFLENEGNLTYVYERAPALSTAAKNVLVYSTRSRKFRRLEPYFPFSATRSASEEDTETAVALPHSRGVRQGAHVCLCQVMD